MSGRRAHKPVVAMFMVSPVVGRMLKTKCGLTDVVCELPIVSVAEVKAEAEETGPDRVTCGKAVAAKLSVWPHLAVSALSRLSGTGKASLV